MLALLIISVWQLFPTLQNSLNNRDLAAMDEAQRAAYLEEHGDDIQATSEEALKLGLDLQGGMHVTLEVGTGALLRELAIQLRCGMFVISATDESRQFWMRQGSDAAPVCDSMRRPPDAPARPRPPPHGMWQEVVGASLWISIDF